MSSELLPDIPSPPKSSPFRNAVARGMGLVLPPLLTIVIVLWIVGTVYQYVMEPVLSGVQNVLVWTKADIKTVDSIPSEQRNRENPILDGVIYARLERGEYVPKTVYDVVIQSLGEDASPKTGASVYRHYFRIIYLRPLLVIPVFILVFTLLLYFLGRFFAAGVGRFFWGIAEAGILHVPFVRSVYSAVKQVSGFLFNERQIRGSRVVAVEYPREGTWTLGFVMGPALPQVQAAVGEECISVMVCTSPMGMSGFAIVVRRRDTIELSMSVEQAVQYIVSCGVAHPAPPKAVKTPGRPAELAAPAGRQS